MFKQEISRSRTRLESSLSFFLVGRVREQEKSEIEREEEDDDATKTFSCNKKFGHKSKRNEKKPNRCNKGPTSCFFLQLEQSKKMVESTQYDKFLLQLIFHVEQKAFLRSLADSVNLINCLKIINNNEFI